MSPDLIADRIAQVRERIAAAATRSGRNPDAVTLIAVSKTVDASIVQMAYDAGVRAFGENRAQELVAKANVLALDCEWHMIGAVQTNKVRQLAPCVGMWHTVDRADLVRSLAARQVTAPVLLEVNVGAEIQKAGCGVEDVERLVDLARSSGLQVRGLMCIPPAADDPRPAFDTLRAIGARLELHHLSMGMTGDFEIAVECGATLVRVGTAIFGPRH